MAGHWNFELVERSRCAADSGFPGPVVASGSSTDGARDAADGKQVLITAGGDASSSLGPMGDDWGQWLGVDGSEIGRLMLVPRCHGVLCCWSRRCAMVTHGFCSTSDGCVCMRCLPVGGAGVVIIVMVLGRVAGYHPSQWQFKIQVVRVIPSTRCWRFWNTARAAMTAQSYVVEGIPFSKGISTKQRSLSPSLSPLAKSKLQYLASWQEELLDHLARLEK